MRNLRAQSGDGYPSNIFKLIIPIGRAAKFIEGMKKEDEQNSQVLVNMARM